MPDHPGFDYWATDDAAHPYPLSEINRLEATEHYIEGVVEIAFPAKIPEAKTVAHRGVGINLLGHMDFYVRFTRLPNGKISMEGVMAIEHGHWFPAHGETDSGKELIFKLTDAEMRKGGTKEILAPHGPHCDATRVSWFRRKGGIQLRMSLMHMEMSPAKLIEVRKKTAEKAKRRPRIEIPLRRFPLKELEDKPDKKAETKDKSEKPKEPGPVGMGPEVGELSDGISGALAGALERVATWLRRG